jgi:hypothetical protein
MHQVGHFLFLGYRGFHSHILGGPSAILLFIS